MTMSELPSLGIALLVGAAIGAIFFGGLWWTVRHATTSRRPALWIFISIILRTSIALVGFYLVGRDDWQRLLFCLVGFVCARFIVIRLVRDRLMHAASTPDRTRRAS